MSSFSSNRVSLFSDNVNIHQTLTAPSDAWYASVWDNLKPWSEFFDYRRVHFPQFSTVALRAKKTTILTNLEYFKFNYVIVFSLIGFMELFTNIPLLLDLTFAGTAVHYIRKIRSKSVKLHVAGKQVRLTISQLYIVVAVVFFPILFWSSPVMTLVWLMLTAGSSVFLHALLLDKPLEISINDLV